MQLDFLKTPTVHFGAFYHPPQGLAETLLEYGSTGLSDGRQKRSNAHARAWLCFN